MIDLLEEFGMSGCKPIDYPMDPNTKFGSEEGEPFPNPSRYRRMVGKLKYLTIRWPDIVFDIGVVS